MNLQEALEDDLWVSHKIGDTYCMDDKPDYWEIAYYPIFENGKTGEVYGEPRALIERPMKGGTDFREVPLRYLIRTVQEPPDPETIVTKEQIRDRMIEAKKLK